MITLEWWICNIYFNVLIFTIISISNFCIIVFKIYIVILNYFGSLVLKGRFWSTTYSSSKDVDFILQAVVIGYSPPKAKLVVKDKNSYELLAIEPKLDDDGTFANEPWNARMVLRGGYVSHGRFHTSFAIEDANYDEVFHIRWDPLYDVGVIIETLLSAYRSAIAFRTPDANDNKLDRLVINYGADIVDIDIKNAILNFNTTLVSSAGSLAGYLKIKVNDTEYLIPVYSTT